MCLLLPHIILVGLWLWLDRLPLNQEILRRRTCMHLMLLNCKLRYLLIAVPNSPLLNLPYLQIKSEMKA